MNKLLIEDCEIIDASFYEVETKEIEIINSNLNGTEFMETSLSGVDLSSCEIGNTTFDLKSIKGIKVNMFQCQSLVSMLGVEVI